MPEFKNCLELTRETLNYYSLLAKIERSLAQFDFQSQQISTCLSEMGLTSVHLLSDADKIEKDIEIKRKALDEQIYKFNIATSQYFVDQIRKKNATSIIESSMAICSQRFDQFIVRSSLLRNIIVNYKTIKRDVLLHGLNELDIDALLHSSDEISSSECFEITSDDFSNANLLVKIQSIEFLNARNLFNQERELFIKTIHENFEDI